MASLLLRKYFLASSDLDLEGDVALVRATDLDLRITWKMMSTQEVECHDER